MTMRKPENPRGAGHLPAKTRAAKRAERERLRKLSEKYSDESGTVPPPWLDQLAEMIAKKLAKPK